MKNRPGDYSAYDRMEVTAFLFHPRRDSGFSNTGENVLEMDIPVDNGVTIGARLHSTDKDFPVILFFHGNGEIVSDYDDLGPLYNEMEINFFPVDYRGYGRSTGSPSVSLMMKDCHAVYSYVKDRLKDNGYTGRFIVMGRSLGSASALELAGSYPDEIDGLIIESGFAYAMPLLRLLGINTNALGIKEEEGFNNTGKIKAFKGPTLIIHSQFDQIIPISDGRALYEASPAGSKHFLEIKGADHNSVFAYGLEDYLMAVKSLIKEVR